MLILIKRIGLLFFLVLSACSGEVKSEVLSLDLSQDFKDYWYDGSAEISSYQLYQERYGEMREGTAVMIFVTE